MILLVMGVAGSGKTTVASLLAERLGWTFVEADEFHPPASKEKMGRGIPLTEEDRIPWLRAIHSELVRLERQKQNVVVACSALKESYRQILSGGLDLRVIYLRGSMETIRHRIEARTEHFAGPSILAGQFAVLEEPREALRLDVTQSPEQLVAQVLAAFPGSTRPRATSGGVVVRKLLWRLLPFLFLLYVVAYLDRINVGFAALQMQSQLGFSDAVYGLGAGIFFLGYFLFQVPSNLAMQRFGARRWIAFLMILWGVISTLMMFVASAKSFYSLRFLLGAAEAGFFPGVIYYLRSWFPANARARVVALFMTAAPISGVIGGPLSGALLELHQRGGLAGWQWLFLLEGIPAILLGFIAHFFLTDKPEEARWLADAERRWLISALQDEESIGEIVSGARSGLRQVLATPRIWLLAFVYLGGGTCSYSIGLWLPTAIHALSGVSSVTIGLLSAIPYIAAVITMVLVGTHSDRTAERRWHIALSAFATCAALIVAAYSASVAPTLAAFTFGMAGAFCMMGPFWALASGALDASTAAAGIAFINAIGNLGSGLGPYWIGYLRTVTGSFRAGLLSVAILLLLVGIAVLVVRARPGSSTA